MTDDQTGSDGKRSALSVLRIRRMKKNADDTALLAPNAGILSSIGKRLRIELNADTTPIPLRMLLVALKLLPPENTGGTAAQTPPPKPPKPDS
jgi:hypothetical protein